MKRTRQARGENTGVYRLAGFTLTELMVAITVSSIAIISIFGMYSQQQKIYQTQQMITDMQQNGRAAMDMLARDIRTSGYGIAVPDAQLPLWIDWVPGFNKNPKIIQGDGTDTDEMIVAGAFGEVDAVLSLAAPTGAVTITVGTGEGIKFNTTTRSVIFLGRSETAKISSIVGDTLSLSTHPTTGGVGLKFPYPAGSSVELIDVITYRQINNPVVFPHQPYLKRENMATVYAFPWQKICAGLVEDIQYVENPYSIDISVMVRASKQDPYYTHPVTSDHYRRLDMVSSVFSRNTLKKVTAMHQHKHPCFRSHFSFATSLAKKLVDQPGRLAGSREGSVLFLVMTFIAALIVLGSTAYFVNKTDIGIVNRSQRTMSAFYGAEAGIDYYRDRVNAALRVRTLNMDQPVETVSFPSPAYAGYTFDPVTTLTRQANPRIYFMSVTGRTRDAETTIDVTLRRKRLINYGIFADQQLDMQPGGSVYSYNSRFEPNPAPAISDGLASAASNGDVMVSSPGTIDGTVFLGENSVGTPGVYSGPADIPSEQVARIDPDPLGMNGGELEADFIYYSSAANNDNNLAATLINSTTLRVTGSVKTITAGNYYLTDFEVGSNKKLIVDASGGPITIYLNGDFKIQPNGEMELIGQPYDFRILSKSTATISLQPNTDFSGFVYAPNAEIRIQPNGHVYGAFWGRTIKMQPNQNVFLDADAMDAILEKRVQILTWKESRRD